MSNGNLYYEIISGLRHKPEYLLLFAVVLVLAGGSTASLTYGLVAGSVATQIISLLALIMTLACTVLVIIVVRKSHTQSADSESVWSKFEATGVNNEEIVNSLALLTSSLRKASVITNQTFRKAIVSRLDTVIHEADFWEKGEVQDFHGHFDIATDVYKNAKHSVFSTSVPEFLPFWGDRAKSKRLLDAHKVSNATVSRVFIFNSRSDITKEVQKILAKHNSEEKIRTLVFIDDETVFTFPPQVAKDFTIIDGGEIIGVASLFRRDEVVGSWHFETSKLKGSFINVKKSLEDDSIEASKLLAELK